MSIPRRQLGTTPFHVSRLSLGCVTFGREIDQADSFAILDAALGAGINLFDTAEAYGGGQVHERANAVSRTAALRDVGHELHSSELILGRWLESRRCRDQVVVQTKVTPPLTRRRILDSIDASRRRLRVDVLDVFLLHAFDSQTPLEETLEALADAVQQGKVKVVGCSNFTSQQLETALFLANADALPRLAVSQFNYNLAVRDAEPELLPLCRDQGVGVQTFSPLGAGFLTGKYDKTSRRLPRGSRFQILPAHADLYFHDDKFKVVERLQRLSIETRLPVAQLAIAWVLSNPAVDTVLVGARTVDHLTSAVASLDVTFAPVWETQLLDGQFENSRMSFANLET